jgi:hypothetical protein
MQIEKFGAGPWAEAVEDGEIVSVAGVEYDMNDLRQDTEKIVEIGDGGGNFLAHIVIPPNTKTTIYEGIVDEDGNEVPSVVDMPVKMDRVKVVLWSLNEISNSEIEE